MFHELINKLIHKIASMQIAEAYSRGYYDKLDENYRNRKIDDEYSIRKSIGKKVIYCPNEWQDPCFLTIQDITYVSKAENPMAVGLDALTGEVIYVWPNSYFPADAKMIKTVLKLNPFERWNMSVGRLSHMSLKWDSKGTKKELTHPSAIIVKLIQCGFYDTTGDEAE